MVVPLVVVVAIPIFLGIVYMPPFEMPEQPEPEEITPKEIPEEPGMDILYFMMMIIWIIFLLRIIIQIKRGTFRVTQRY